MTAAKSSDCITLPLPDEVKELPFQKEYTHKEMERIKLGLLPQQMEDKWFIYYENDTLNFHRSWTGSHIYQVAFVHSKIQSKVVKTLVHRDSSQYSEEDDAYDVQLLNYLIDRLLLDKKVEFPLPDSVDDENEGIFRHAVIGYGRSNEENL